MVAGRMMPRMPSLSLQKRASERLTKEQDQYDGLLPNRRSAMQRQQSFRIQQGQTISSRSLFGSSAKAGSVRKSILSKPSGVLESYNESLDTDNSLDGGSDHHQAHGDESNSDEAALELLRQSMKCASLRGNNFPAHEGPLKITTQEASVACTYRLASSVHHKKLQFAQVTVHYHGTILGHHPTVSSGAPLALDDKRVLESETMALDQYESKVRRRQALPSNKLKLSAATRQRMLRQAGISQVDINRRIETCDQMRFQLMESVRKAKASDAANARKKAKAAAQKAKGGGGGFRLANLFHHHHHSSSSPATTEATAVRT